MGWDAMAGLAQRQPEGPQGQSGMPDGYSTYTEDELRLLIRHTEHLISIGHPELAGIRNDQRHCTARQDNFEKAEEQVQREIALIRRQVR